jgi:hypothetical protein
MNPSVSLGENLENVSFGVFSNFEQVALAPLLPPPEDILNRAISLADGPLRGITAFHDLSR